MEVAADFREKYHISFFDIGKTVEPEEAYLLLVQLMKNPSSWLYASRNELKYPVQHTDILMMDLYDLTMALNVKKEKRQFYPRPWNKPKNTERLTSVSLPLERAKELLKKMNPSRE